MLSSIGRFVRDACRRKAQDSILVMLDLILEEADEDEEAHGSILENDIDICKFVSICNFRS